MRDIKPPHSFTITICAEAGTYIKEFVNGDLGRTTPSVREILGCETHCEQLDVMNVDLEWPPVGLTTE